MKWRMNDLDNILISHAELFYRVAFHLLESREEAEDAVQELYLKLYESKHRLMAVSEPLAYGISVLRNICIDRIRRRTVRKAEPVDERIPLEEAPPDSRAVSKDLLESLMTEIDKLPDRQAVVLKMKAVEGLDYKEIAETTGLSQVHVRVLVSTARKTLKRRLRI